MNACMQQSRLTSIDVALLTLLMLAQCPGYVAAFWSLSLWFKLGAALLFQLVLLGWLALWSTPGEIWPNLRRTMQLQLHAAAQLLPGMYVTAAFSIVSVWVIRHPAWLPYVRGEQLVHFHNMALTLVLLAAQLLGAVRVHALHRKGLALSAVLDGSLNRMEQHLPAALEKVQPRLAHYLAALTKPGAPSMSRLWYGRVPVVRELADAEAEAEAKAKTGANGKGYSVTWRDCPARIRITLTSPAPGSTLLQVACELRGGQHRLDLRVNPIDALALMEFIQANVVQLLVSELNLSDAAARQDALRLHAVEMQLRILQAQVEPHFLFNTLANVRHLYRSSVQEGEAMLDHLIDYLRGSMHELRSDRSTVAQEFDLVLHYLAIMKIRMGERLSYTFIQNEEVAQHAFPPAMLISLVENALMHGLHDRADGILTISAACESGQVRVTVRDNGAGFSTVQGSGTGLSNIRQRLEALYGQRAWLEVGALHDGGFMSSILIPMEGN